MIRTLQTVDLVIDACGGTAAVAALTGRSPQAVSNWRAEQKLPPKTFLIFELQLRQIGAIAPPKLWGIDRPKRQRGGR